MPPKRVLGGPDTQLSLGKQNTDNTVVAGGGNVYGGGNVPCIRIDPIHNLLAGAVDGRGPNGGSVLIFDRTASGNTPPKAIIKGPVRMGNQFDIYPPSLQVDHVTRETTLRSGRVPETGTSTDPPMKISAPLGRQSGDVGLVLDPLHKEAIVATRRRQHRRNLLRAGSICRPGGPIPQHSDDLASGELGELGLRLSTGRGF